MDDDMIWTRGEKEGKDQSEEEQARLFFIVILKPELAFLEGNRRELKTRSILYELSLCRISVTVAKNKIYNIFDQLVGL